MNKPSTEDLRQAATWLLAYEVGAGTPLIELIDEAGELPASVLEEDETAGSYARVAESLRVEAQRRDVDAAIRRAGHKPDARTRAIVNARIARVEGR